MKLSAIALFLCSTSALAGPALAGGFSTAITDTINLQVQGSAVQMERIGSSYSVSGTNITTTETAGIGMAAATSSAAALKGSATFAVKTDGQAFNFTESLKVGDSVVSAQTLTSGVITAPVLYGINTTQAAGVAGSLAGTLSPTGVSSIVSGGPGTTAIGQRSVSLSVFD